MDVPDSAGKHVFLCYARVDAPAVDRLQAAFEEAGIQVWRDTARLWPGENWQEKIRAAIGGDALAFVACFSTSALVRDRSFQNEELALAVEELRLRRPDVSWLFPVRLDDCEIPDLPIGAGRTLNQLQRAELFGEKQKRETARLVTAVRQIFSQPAAVISAGAVAEEPAAAEQPRPREIVADVTKLREAGSGLAADRLIRAAGSRPPGEIAELTTRLRASGREPDAWLLLDAAITARADPGQLIRLVTEIAAVAVVETTRVVGMALGRLTGDQGIALADALRAAGCHGQAFRAYATLVPGAGERPVGETASWLRAMRVAHDDDHADRVVRAATTSARSATGTAALVSALWWADVIPDACRILASAAARMSAADVVALGDALVTTECHDAALNLLASAASPARSRELIAIAWVLHKEGRQADSARILEVVLRWPLERHVRLIYAVQDSGRSEPIAGQLIRLAARRPVADIRALITTYWIWGQRANIIQLLEEAAQACGTRALCTLIAVLPASEDTRIEWLIDPVARHRQASSIGALTAALRASGQDDDASRLLGSVAQLSDTGKIRVLTATLRASGQDDDASRLLQNVVLRRSETDLAILITALRSAGQDADASLLLATALLPPLTSTRFMGQHVWPPIFCWGARSAARRLAAALRAAGQHIGTDQLLGHTTRLTPFRVIPAAAVLRKSGLAADARCLRTTAHVTARTVAAYWTIQALILLVSLAAVIAAIPILLAAEIIIVIMKVIILIVKKDPLD